MIPIFFSHFSRYKPWFSPKASGLQAMSKLPRKLAPEATWPQNFAKTFRLVKTWPLICHIDAIYHWIDLRENLQETMDFTIKYRAFLYIFPSSNSMNLDVIHGIHMD